MLYILEEKAPKRPPLVTDEGVTLPAHLTASGRAILAYLPKQQVRALFPSGSAFTTLQGTGPSSPITLKKILDQTKQLSYGFVSDDVTPGVSSLAVPIFDTNDAPIAALAVTYYASQIGEGPGQVTELFLLEQLRNHAQTLQNRLTGQTQS